MLTIFYLWSFCLEVILPFWLLVSFPEEPQVHSSGTTCCCPDFIVLLYMWFGVFAWMCKWCVLCGLSQHEPFFFWLPRAIVFEVFNLGQFGSLHLTVGCRQLLLKSFPTAMCLFLSLCVLPPFTTHFYISPHIAVLHILLCLSYHQNLQLLFLTLPSCFLHRLIISFSILWYMFLCQDPLEQENQ